MTLIGMWQPGGHPVEIEHVYADVRSDLAWVQRELRRIFAAGRAPLLTVEPHVPPGPELVARWARVLEGEAGEVVYVRYMHEMNGTWYPWAGDPDRFRREWARWTAAMPPNVRNVFCPNVDYPDAHPIGHYLMDHDVFGVDGYARNGETPAELFRPTLDKWAGIFHTEPVWICETAAPRGRKQARYAGALRDFCEQQGIEAVVWFNADKAGQGPDERDWTLTKGAARALLGRDR